MLRLAIPSSRFMPVLEAPSPSHWLLKHSLLFTLFRFLFRPRPGVVCGGSFIFSACSRSHCCPLSLLLSHHSHGFFALCLCVRVRRGGGMQPLLARGRSSPARLRRAAPGTFALAEWSRMVGLVGPGLWRVRRGGGLRPLLARGRSSPARGTGSGARGPW